MPSAPNAGSRSDRRTRDGSRASASQMLLNEYGALVSRLPIQRLADWHSGRSCIRAVPPRQRMASISTAARIARWREMLSAVHVQPATSVPVTRSLLRLPGNLRGPTLAALLRSRLGRAVCLGGVLLLLVALFRLG